MTVSLEKVCNDLTAIAGTPTGREDELRLRQLATLLMPQSAAAVMEGCDIDLLTTRRPLGGPVYTDPERPLVGRLRLPDDFMRLISLQLKGWTSAVTRAILPSDGPAYALRLSPWSEISGNTVSPRCYLTAGPAGNWLEIHGLPATPAAIIAEYAPRPAWHDCGIDIPRALYPEVMKRLGADVAIYLK